MRQEKQLLLDDVKEKIDAAPAMVLLSYKNLDPNKAANLRDEVRKTGGTLYVCSKRVFLKAAAESGIEFNRDSLQGHFAVAFTGEDSIESTKSLYKFSEDNEDTLDVMAGHFDGSVVSTEDVKAISKLPSKQEMRSMFVGVLAAPMQQTVGILNTLLTSVPNCLENKRKKEESEQ